MTTVHLLADLGRRGVRIWAEGETLRFSAPPQTMTQELRSELKTRKPEILAFLREARADSTPNPAPHDGGGVPLSFAQRRLWFLEQLGETSGAYAAPLALDLEGPLDVPALGRALAEIIRRHEVLRTVFRARGGEPVQVVLAPAAVALPVYDLSGLPGWARGAVLEGLVADEVASPFDLEQGPVLRARLFRTAPGEHRLLVNVHHVATDEWSVGVFFHELSALYGAFVRGEGSPLPPLPAQYADYALRQRERLTGETLARLLGYWKERLNGAPDLLELPTDRPRPASRSFRGAVHSFALPAALRDRLATLGRSEAATPFMVALSAYAVFLARYSAQEDVVVGSPVGGRDEADLEGLIGFFVNTLALRIDLAGDPSFRELLRRVRDTCLDAYNHQELPFDKVVDELHTGRSLGHNPVFQVAFSYHATTSGEAPELAGLGVRPADLPIATAKFDLTLHVQENATGLGAAWEYASDLFDAATVARMAEHLAVLLEGIARDPELRVSRLPLLSPAERRRVLEAPNRAAGSFAADRCVHALVSAQAARRPDAVAVVCEDEALSYGELAARANRLAARLRALGAGPGVRVGLCLERSVELVAAILGILKSGAAYVPLDPGLPADRVAFILKDAGVTLLVTDTRLLESRPALAAEAATAPVGVVRLDDQSGCPAAPPDAAPEAAGSPSDPAYVIYTSGSTGRPKGVVVTHANVARLLTATDAWYGFGEDDVWTLFHSCAFDFSVWELWGALAYGGRLVVVPYWVSRSPDAFHELVARERGTVLNQTPSAFRHFVRADEDAPAPLALRYVIFGGEALDPSAVRRWFGRHGEESPRLVNMYGITETTVHVSYCPLGTALLDATPPGVTPIGVPIPDLRVYVLDPAREPVPFGVKGELYVSGPGVAPGYLNRPELTSDRFLADPFVPGETMYRTGDLARMRPDGTLEYVGRIDHQVKLRGFRIELGEIEAALADLPGMRGAAVLLREDTPGDKQLVAYVVPGTGPEAHDPDELRQALAARLPDYMIPAAFVALAELPLTSQGKLDRRALPAPAGAHLRRAACEPPANALESRIQEVWRKVLRADRIGVTDDFFAIGGDSLRAVQLAAALRGHGVPLTVRDIFRQPSIRALARMVATTNGGQPVAGVPHHLADVAEAEWARARAVFGEVEDVYPAARMQALMLEEYAHDRSRAGVYHPQQLHRVTDPRLSVGALHAALRATITRQPSFRAAFLEGSDGRLLQVIRSTIRLPVDGMDLRELEAPDQERAIRARIAADLDTPFDPFDPRGALVRAVIFQRSDSVAELFLSGHHAIEDGWGNVQFLNALFAAYEDARDGRPLRDDPAPDVFREFVALEQEILASPEARAFWGARMERARRTRPERLRSGTGRYEEGLVREIPRALTAALRQRSARERVALKALYLSAFLDLLASLSEGEEACAGVVWNGRSERLSDPLGGLGIFWNLLPVPRPAVPDPAERVRALHEDLLRIDPFGRYPLAEISPRGSPEPFFATFNFLHFHHWAVPDEGRGLRVEPVWGYDRFHSPLGFAVSLEPQGEGGILVVQHDDRRLGRADAVAAVEEYLRRLEHLASSDADAPPSLSLTQEHSR